jgi:hypothetical protein
MKVGLPLLKWLFEKKEKRNLSDKEFGELIALHIGNRDEAGQTVLDGEKVINKLESRLAKKNNEE